MAVAKKFTASVASLASPIGGWNARDSLAEMNPLDAVQLINFFPTPSDVTLRKGFTKTSTGITGNVQTLMNYANQDGTNTLFAVANGVIYNASTSTATSVFTGLTNSKFQHCMISTDGGNFLYRSFIGRFADSCSVFIKPHSEIPPGKSRGKFIHACVEKTNFGFVFSIVRLGDYSS